MIKEIYNLITKDNQLITVFNTLLISDMITTIYALVFRAEYLTEANPLLAGNPIFNVIWTHLVLLGIFVLLKKKLKSHWLNFIMTLLVCEYMYIVINNLRLIITSYM